METEQKPSSKDPEVVQEYNKEYYKKQRDRIAEQKKERYRTDPKVREKSKTAVQKFRERKRKKSGHRIEKVYNFHKYPVTRIGYICKLCDVTYADIDALEKAKILPEAIFGKARCYTDGQVVILTDLLKVYKAEGLVKMIENKVKVNQQTWMWGIV